MINSIKELNDFGQSIWLDYIDRPLLESGKLTAMIQEGLMGMTSNPSIFNNAIGSSSDYDKKIRMLNEAGKTTFEIYDELTIGELSETTKIPEEKLKKILEKLEKKGIVKHIYITDKYYIDNLKEALKRIDEELDFEYKIKKAGRERLLKLL